MKKKQMYELIKKDFAPTDNTDNIGDKKPVPLEDKATSIDDYTVQFKQSLR